MVVFFLMDAVAYPMTRKNPLEQNSQRREDPVTGEEIPWVKVNSEKPFCCPRRASYHHGPRTRFQQTVRQPRYPDTEEVENGVVDLVELQHFTRVLKDSVVARYSHLRIFLIDAYPSPG